jgi:hypothetical protein
VNPTEVPVAIIDNGFWGVECSWPNDCPRRAQDGSLSFSTPFRSTFFNTETFAGTGEIGPMTSDDIWPINFRNRLGAPPTINAISGHGTHVAGLLVGGATFNASHRDLFSVAADSWLKLIIVNIAPGSLTFASDANERLFLLLNQESDRPKVVNMSLAFNEARSKYVRDLIEDPVWQGTLFVVAAGNEAAALDGEPSYPAVMGGEASDNVLTVASVDGSGRLSGFSNHSKSFVDIAAPGCKIRSWLTATDQTTPVTGTSQATSIASFGAALLKALWKTASPRQIKNRLAYSGDLMAGAEDRTKTRFGTKINLFDALLMRTDVLHFVEAAGSGQPERHRTVIGTLSELQGVRCAGGTETPWSQVRSFRSTSPGAGQLIRQLSSYPIGCPATIDSAFGTTPNKAFFQPVAEWIDGQFKPLGGTIQVSVGDIQGFVRREL